MLVCSNVTQSVVDIRISTVLDNEELGQISLQIFLAYKTFLLFYLPQFQTIFSTALVVVFISLVIVLRDVTVTACFIQICASPMQLILLGKF